MGSPCWGAPQQGLMAPNSSEFPDVRLQYQWRRLCVRCDRRLSRISMG